MLCATAMVLMTASAYAQKPTNFAGTWTRDAPAGGAAAAGGGGGGGGRGGGRGGGGAAFNCGMECTIAQDATSITITTMTQNGPGEPRKINLTGDTKISVPGRQGGAATEITAKSKWVGDKLEISVTRDMQGTMVTSTTTLSMAAGKLTVVNNSGQADAQPTTTTYTKK
jgi:hypothetical protein